MLALNGCASDASDDRWNSLIDGIGKNTALPHSDTPRTKIVRNDNQLASQNAFMVPGTGQFVNPNTASISRVISDGGKDGYTLNLVEAPVAQAAKQILGDIMGYNYLVDPRVQGQITLQTSSPVSKAMLLEILETSLAVNHAAIVKRNGRYDIVPETEALKSAPSIDVSGLRAEGPGVRLQVIQLRYIAADEMKGSQRSGRPGLPGRHSSELARENCTAGISGISA